MTRISRRSRKQPGASDSTRSDATSGLDSLTTIFAAPACPGLLDATVQYVIVAIQSHARLHIAQFCIRGHTSHAHHGSGGRIDLDRNPRAADAVRSGFGVAVHGASPRESCSVCRPVAARLWPKGQFARGKPLRGSRFAVRAGDDVAGGAISFDSTTRSVRGQHAVLNTSTAQATSRLLRGPSTVDSQTSAIAHRRRARRPDGSSRNP